MRFNRDRGFTLVEMLLVVAIIGVLVSLLLPAVQAAREAARRSQCSNNLKQIGLAVDSYEDTYKCYPPGAFWYGPDLSKRRRGPTLIHILPYLEQRQLYDAFDFSLKKVENSVFSGSDKLVASVQVPTYICPSDEHEGSFAGRALHNYAASRGPTEVYVNPTCSCAYQWQSFAMAPLDDPTNYAGPFTRVGVCTRLGEVTDGLSNTIFFGEVRPKCSIHAQSGWATTNNGNGYCTTLIPINYDSCDENAPDPCHRPCNWNTEVGFKSAHPGGAQFLLGDGSVQLLHESIDYSLYQRLGAKSDGQDVSGQF
jgi:prepilin-type N-terminal cleavage/methylation domain-containing protein